MTLQGKDGGTWKDASAVYGKSSGSWLYAKEVWANKAGTWTRAWTDCRKFDASGRGWSSSTANFTDGSSCGGCGVKSKTVTTYTKTGCPNDVRDPGYTGSCSDAWTSYFDFVVVQLTSGQYVNGSIWGWYYCDSAGNGSTTCNSGTGLVGPGGVERCSVAGTYRKTGTDQCVTVSCC